MAMDDPVRMKRATTQTQYCHCTPAPQYCLCFEIKNSFGKAPRYQDSALILQQAPMNDVEIMIKDFLKNKARTPKATARIAKVMSKGRLAIPDFIRQSAMLFRMKDKITPIQAPSPKVPSFGKYRVTYPMNILVIPVIITMLLMSPLGTPGTNMTMLSISNRIPNPAIPPTSQMVIRYIYNPRSIKTTPKINVVKKKANLCLSKQVQIVVRSSTGHPEREEITTKVLSEKELVRTVSQGLTSFRVQVRLGSALNETDLKLMTQDEERSSGLSNPWEVMVVKGMQFESMTRIAGAVQSTIRIVVFQSVYFIEQTLETSEHRLQYRVAFLSQDAMVIWNVSCLSSSSPELRSKQAL